MQFSHSQLDKRNKTTNFALIAGLHVVLGTLFVHSLNTRSLSLPTLPQQVLVMLDPQTPEPPPPLDPPKPMPTLAPPDVFVPKVEVDVAPPPQPSPVIATTEPDPAPAPVSPSATVPDAAPTPATTSNTGVMHTAVFADANGCALPEYPARAARNGETGTTTLALLVGTDGHVTSARVEHSSGSRELDRAAVNALSLCRFKPATSNGVPEAGWAQLAYVWTLN